MSERLIYYSGYWDGPLAFVVSHEGTQYFFRRGYFDDEIDDYPVNYKVYVLPDIAEKDISKFWENLPIKTKVYIGSIHLYKVLFDPTKRKYIDSDTFSLIASGGQDKGTAE